MNTEYRNKDGVCERIRCPQDQIGDFQPNCKHLPKCPAEYPGVWPNCNIYQTTPKSKDPTTTTRRSTKAPSTYLPPIVPTTTTVRPTLRTIPTTTTTRATTTTRRTTTTTTKPPINRCHCECYSNDIIILKDHVEINPFEKYRKVKRKVSHDKF